MAKLSELVLGAASWWHSEM